MERVLLIGVFETEKASRGDDVRFEMSMKELDALVSACEMKPVGMSVQQMPLANKAAYVGAGKLSEIQARLQELSADGIVANDTLTPTQLRNLSKELKVEVMDRTALILEIFKKRARSREARLQVELAHLQYIKPRLIGMWEKHLSGLACRVHYSNNRINIFTLAQLFGHLNRQWNFVSTNAFILLHQHRRTKILVRHADFLERLAGIVARRIEIDIVCKLSITRHLKRLAIDIHYLVDNLDIFTRQTNAAFDEVFPLIDRAHPDFSKLRRIVVHHITTILSH